MSTNRFANRHGTAKIDIRVDEGSFWACSNGIEKPADKASECGTKRNIADLHVGEANRPQSLDMVLCYLGRVLANRLGIGKHRDVPITEAG